MSLPNPADAPDTGTPTCARIGATTPSVCPFLTHVAPTLSCPIGHKKAKDKTAKWWVVTVNRKAGKRKYSECGKYTGKPNKCSAKGTGNPWPKNPKKGAFIRLRAVPVR